MADDPTQCAPRSSAKVEIWLYKWEQNAERDVHLIVDVAEAQIVTDTRLHLHTKTELRNCLWQGRNSKLHLGSEMVFYGHS